MNFSIVTLDIGGTCINAGRFHNDIIEDSYSVNFPAQQSETKILQFIIDCINRLIQNNTIAIAIGVPSIVDIERGIVFDAVNIPAWKKYHLKAALNEHYPVGIYINNDVNCFTIGERCYGKAKAFKDVVGICLGTGMGSGFVFNDQLHVGHNCSAGEVGGIRYLDGTIDDYCSGKFFKKHYSMSGEELAQRAEQGDKEAIAAFEQYGKHLAHAISQILFIVDPQMIVIGGSVAKSYHLFIDSLWRSLQSFPYHVVVKNLSIVKSELDNAALLGAAHLYLVEQELDKTK